MNKLSQSTQAPHKDTLSPHRGHRPASSRIIGRSTYIILFFCLFATPIIAQQSDSNTKPDKKKNAIFFSNGLQSKYRDDTEGAIRNFEQALIYMPNDDASMFELSEQYYNAGRIEDAFRMIQQAANLDPEKGLPRIRGYCRDILGELESKGVGIDNISGGLDEYAVLGEESAAAVRGFSPDLTVIMGICHAYPDINEKSILITDQPRELKNYLDQGFTAVGEAGSHTMVMGAKSIVTLETAETLRELL